MPAHDYARDELLSPSLHAGVANKQPTTTEVVFASAVESSHQKMCL